MTEILPLQINRTPWGLCRVWAWPVLCAGGVLAMASPARAQLTTGTYFPTGNFGYDQDLGVTVQSRARPEYEPLGIQLGGFTIRPELAQSLFDNSNVNGSSAGNSASWGSQTNGSVTGASDWGRNSLDASIGFDHYKYFAPPGESYTNWNIGIGGGYTIGDSELLASYSHSSFNQLGTTIGMASSDTPALDTTDTGELSYTFNFGRFAVTPILDLSAYRFGPVTTGGVEQVQSQYDRDVVAGGVVTRYALTGAAGLLVVTRGTTSDYINTPAGQLSNNSTSAEVLAGLDYEAKSVWRYSLLVGVEYTAFAAAQYGSYTGPIVSADVVYTPTGVLTITGTATRSLEDTDTTGNSGFVLSEANLVVDYELLRNVLLEGRGGFQYATYIQGGSQSNETVGGGVTWLINRNVQLSVNDDYTNQSSASSAVNLLNGGQNTTPLTANTTLSGAFTQNVLLLTLQLAL